MRVVISGSRTITDIKLIEMSIAESGFDVSEVIGGRCHNTKACERRKLMAKIEQGLKAMNAALIATGKYD